MDNKVNDLRYAVKFENHVKNKKLFIKQTNVFLLSKTFLSLKTIFFNSWKSVFFMSPKNSIASAFFLLRQILKNIDMPRLKPWYLPTAEANSKRCKVRI